MRRLLQVAFVAMLLSAAGLVLRATLPTVQTGTWQPAGNLQEQRTGAASVLMADGSILTTGGANAVGSTQTAEVLRANGSMSAVASMGVARSRHTATVLNADDARVLVAGGIGANGAAIAAAEEFDPIANTWTPVGSLNFARSGQTATELEDGRVLIVGGENSGVPVAAVEVYDPSTQTFTVVDNLATPRMSHAAVGLDDGSVLVIGGFGVNNQGNLSALSSAELFDPATNKMGPAVSLKTARASLSATKVVDGNVVVAGGSDGTNDLASIEIYDTTTAKWSYSAASLASARSGHTATLLPNSNAILISGGTTAGVAQQSAQMYRPWNDDVVSAGAMTAPRVLASGSPLSAGGPGNSTAIDGLYFAAGGSGSASTELFRFATIRTDKGDYAPGTIVHMTGTGFRPGETVSLHMHESVNNTIFDNPNFAVTAGQDGTINYSDYAPTPSDLGGYYHLTAVGQASGFQAQTTFYDSTATTTTLTSPTNPSVSGQSITLTATITGGDGTNNLQGSSNTATVNFKDGGTSISGCSAQSVSSSTSTSTSTCTTTFTQGSHSLSAVYSGVNGKYLTSTGTLTQTVNQASTTTVVSPTTASVFGQSVTFTATVSANSPGSGTPTGTVTFKDGSTTLGTGTLSGGVATFSTSSLSVTSHSITAVYGADTNFTGSTSSAVTQTVNQASTTTVVSPTTSSVFGQSVTFTATVSAVAPGAGTPTGTVTFKDGATTLGTGTLSSGVATFSTSSLSVTSHSITAVYGADTNFTTSTSSAVTQTVNKASTTTVVSPTTSSVFGQSVTFTATVSAVAPGAGTPTGTVTFKDGATTLGTGTLSSGVATFSTSSLSVTSHSITAVYGADTNFTTSTSSAVTQTVNQASTSTVVSPTTASVFGQSVTFTATVSANSPGSGTPTGTVTFKDGSTTLGTGTLSGGVATFSTSSLSVTSHSITAVYGADTNFTGSTSSAVTQTVNQASTTTVVSPTSASVFGQSVTFTATVSVNSPGAGTPTGTVTFKDGATTLGTGTLSSAVATFSTSSLSVTSHSITAVYGADTNFTTSTSSAVTQTVNQASTTTSVLSANNPAVFGQAVILSATVSAAAPGSGTPTGTVTFKDGSTTLGTGTLSGGSASLSISSLSVSSTHSITVVYGGDTNFLTSTSSAMTQTVTKANSSTVVTGSSPSVFGQSVTFTATVSAVAPGAGTPAGTVQFFDGSTSLGTSTTSGGVATLAVSSLSVGTHSIKGVFTDSDGNFNNSDNSGALLTQVVNQASTSTSAVSPTPGSPSTYGQSVTFSVTVSVTAPGAGTPTGTVTFKDGITTLGSGAVVGGIASYNTTSTQLSGGSHSITASYSGDTNFAGSNDNGSPLSYTVNRASSTTAFTSTSPDSLAYNHTYQATASTSGDGTPVIGASGACSANGSGLVTINSGSGTCTVTATTAQTTNYLASSATAQSITATKATATVTITNTTATYDANQHAVTVTTNPSSLAVDVTYTDSNNVTSSTPPTTAGSYGVSAVINDANYQGSNTATLTINPYVPGVGGGDSGGGTYGQATTLTATITPNGGAPSGTVTFSFTLNATTYYVCSDGSVPTTPCTVPVQLNLGDNKYEASVTTSNLPAGNYSITAAYSGDTDFGTGTPAPISINIGQATTNVTLTPSPSTGTFEQATTFNVTVSDATANSSAIPTGTVTLSYQFGSPTPTTYYICSDGSISTSSCTLTLDSNGQASTVPGASGLPGGSYSIVAAYSGDANFSAPTPAGVLYTVNPATTATSLNVSPSTSAVGDSVQMTATVTVNPAGTNPGSSDGTVQFKISTDGSSFSTYGPPFSLSGNVVTLITTTLPAGTQAIKASYSGNTNFHASDSDPFSVTVVGPPTISKAFGASTIPLNGSTTLTFTITNPAANSAAENGIAFSDTLTGGLQVASTPGVSNNCNGTVTAAANSTSISLSGGSIATPGNTCTITVNVTGTQAGAVLNTTGAVSSTNGGTGQVSNTATLTVVAPPSVTSPFNPTSIPLNGTSTLTIHITNPNSSASLSPSFTDNLPAGIVVATPSNLSNTCGGTATATAASSSVSLSGGTLAASASCSVSVDVTGTSAGEFNNSVQVSSTEGGSSNTSTTSLTVVGPPTVSNAFNPTSIPLNGTSTLTFTVTNSNQYTNLSGIAFSDTLPAGLTIASPNGLTGNCTGTITATAGTNAISLSGASLGLNSVAGLTVRPTTVVLSNICTFSVNVTGTTAGDHSNTTGTIASTEGGTGSTSNTATLTVVAPPTISKSFGAGNIQVNGTTTLSFTITNPSANTTAENGIWFTDTLASGLQVASTPGISNTCGGTVTAAANSTSISLSGGSIATPGSTCTIVVNVTGTQAGTVTNTTGAVSSTNGGTGATSNTANLVVAAAPVLTAGFSSPFIPLGGTATLTFTVTNPNSTLTLTGVGLVGTLDVAMRVAPTPNVSNTCGGTVSAAAGSNAVSFSGGSVAAQQSCQFSVDIRPTSYGPLQATGFAATSTEGGTSNALNPGLLVVAPPTISDAFTPTSIPLNGTTTLSFTVTNPNFSTSLSNVAFSDTLPAGLVIATPNGLTGDCGGGTITATQNTKAISLSGGSLGMASSSAGVRRVRPRDVATNSCTFSVNVVGTTAGNQSNTTGAVSSYEGGTGTTSNTATVSVVAPPTISKAFGATNIALNGTTTLTFTITNPANNAEAENGIAFSDTLTNGLQVASTPGASTSCTGGTVTAAANSTSISLSGGSIATPGSTCTVVVNVTGTQSGTVSNTTGAVSSTNGGTGSTSNTATLTVASPPSISTQFGASSIPLNGTTSLTFTISNPNSGLGLTGVAFSDSLPSGLVVASTPPLSNTCNGTATATAGSGSISLSGGTIAASGSCSVSVNVTGTTAGAKQNSTQVTSTEGGSGNTSSVGLTVVAPPTISKAFGASSIPLNGTTTLSFTVTNPNSASGMTGVAFTDTLPAGLSIATPDGLTGTCGSGTITVNRNANVINLVGGSLGPAPVTGLRGVRPALTATNSCTFSVNVVGTAAGDQQNTTGAVSSTEGGTGATSNTATLSVVAPPTISKAFGAANIALNGTTTLTFTITNPANNTVAENGIAFSDTLTNGLQVASTPGASTSCTGGTVTAVANSTSISLSGGSIATPGSTCTVVVNVTGTQSGTVSNITGAVSSTNGGTGSTSNTATLTVASAPSISTQFGASSIPLNGTTSLTFTISNPNSGLGLTGVAFSDSLPSGLVVASTPPLSNTCNGTATATAGSGSISLSGGTIAASGSCSVSVNVTGTTAGAKQNSTQVSSNEAGSGNTSSANLTVFAPPTISKAFGASSIPLNGTTTLSFTVTNPNASGISGLAFTDTLPAGLVIATPNGLTGNCNGTVSATQNTNVISLSGGSIGLPTGAGLRGVRPSGAVVNSCTFSVNVTGTAAGDQNNTTGAVTSTEGGTGATSNTATVTVVAPPTIGAAFGAASIPVNGTTTVTFTITNPSANTAAENGIAFSDTLPGALPIASTPNVSNTCGGTVTASANTTFISLTDGSITTPGSTCSVSVNVTGTQSGATSTTTGAVSSTNGGTGSGSNTAHITVAGAPATTVQFGASTIPLNGTTTLVIGIQNSNSNIGFTGLQFTDSLPAGLVVASTPALSNTCNGTATATAGSGSVSLSGGTLAASGSCSVTVNVTGTTAGGKVDSVQTSSAEAGAGNTATAGVTVATPPTIAKQFGAASIPVGGTTTVSFTVANNNGNVSLTGVGFSDTLPAGLVIATPNGLTASCSGTITAVQNTNVISLSGASLASASSAGLRNRPSVSVVSDVCTFSVNVTGTSAGALTNTTGNVTSVEGGTGGTASASIHVEGPPSIAAIFSPASIQLNGTSSLQFTITNPVANPDALAVVQFTDTLPANLTVASGTTTACGGTLTTTAPNGIALTNGSISTSSNCQFSVTVTGTASGQYTNTTGNVSSSNGGTGNTASANLVVGLPPTIAKAFGAARIAVNGTTTLTFTIQNPNTSTLTGVSFTDSLPSGLVVAATPGLSNTCGGTATATAGATSASLSAGSIAASGSCVVSLNVRGTTAGVKNNSVTVNSANGTGNTSNASVTVVAPPTLAKAFGAGSIFLNNSTSLTFTVTNPNTGTTLTGIGFSDTLPAGLVVSTPNGLTGSCGGGTISGAAGGTSITLTGAQLASSASCTFAVNVTGTAAGTDNNTTSTITSVEGGAGAAATASLSVVAPPTFTTAFSPSIIPVGGTSTLTFTLSSPAANPVKINKIAFTDTLPTGLTVASSSASTCSGTLTTTSPTSISLSSGSLTAGTSCQFSVTVTGASAGNYTNTTSSVTTANAGTSAPSSASLTVAVPGPPTAVSVSPSSGSGSSQTFAFLFSDPLGVNDISTVQAKFGTSATSYVSNCSVAYIPSSKQLYLMPDNGANWLGPVTVGSAGTIQNSQCSINTGSSSATSSGQNFTLNLAVTFSSTFVGVKNSYAQIQNVGGQNSGWQTLGTWTNGSAGPPAPVSVTPNSGSGTSQTFAFLYSDPNGASDISYVQARFGNSATSYVSNCSVAYIRGSNQLYLMPDSGANWLGPVTVGSAGTIQNSQCTINLGTSSATSSGNNLTLNLAVAFSNTFLGTKNIYGQVQNVESQDSGFQTLGTWTNGTAGPPSAVSVTPNSGTGTSQTFAFLYNDPNGTGDISYVQAKFGNDPVSYVSNCSVAYIPSSNQLYLMPDNGANWLGPVTVGSAGTIQNSQCTINLGTSSANSNGANLTLNLAVTLTGSTATNIYGFAQNAGAQNSGWQTLGSWTP